MEQIKGYMKFWATFYLMFLTCMVLAGCHDDDDDNDQPTPEPPATEWKVNIVGADADEMPLLSLQASYESLLVNIDGRDDSTQTVLVSSSEEWLQLATDTLSADGIVVFTTSTNNDDQRRIATLTFSDANDPSRQGTLQVAQLSRADSNTNGSPRDQLFIGYGYDIFKALEDPMAVRTLQPVLDYEDLITKGGAGTYQIISDCHLSQTKTEYVASNEITAFGKDLSAQQTRDDEYEFEGCVQNCQTALSLVENSNGLLYQHNLGHGTLSKTVAARVLDRAALIDLQRRGQMPYQAEFAERLRKIRYDLKGDRQREAIEKVVTDYGTHVIIEVDLGGRIDYTFTMQKATSFNTEEEMKEEIEYTLGRIADTERTTSAKSTSSAKSAAGAITVKGGSAAARQQLENDIKGLTPTGQIDPAHITDWLATIEFSDNYINDENLEVTHFEIIPLWDIVPDDVRLAFLDVIIHRAKRSDCQLPASVLGTDIYELTPQRDNALFGFRNMSSDASLCRLLYYENEPVLQVCSEYVPKIRTDERVTIAYPIYKQRIRLNQGLFIGDGIHQPAFVGFSGSDCYVNPIPSMKPGTLIEKFYYINGSLNIGSENARFISEDQRGRTVRDDAFYFRVSGTTHKHPIVKIGSNFWTRRDLNHKMGLALKPSDDRTLDQLKDGIVYARFWHDLGRSTSSQNKWMWGYDPNTMFPGNPNMKWYYPSGDEVKNLLEFMGFNPKALFRGQATGFEAQFNGYYGGYDVEAKQQTDDPKVRAKGELNCFATRNKETDNSSILMVLDKNYRLYVTENGASGVWRQNYYPVRPTRGYMYDYPTLKDYLDFEEKYK